jgi:adenylate kinase family enzyme
MPIESFLPLAGAWLWNTYGQALGALAVDFGKEKWNAAKWEKAARVYRAKIIKVYDSVQVLGMVEPMPLQDIFTDVYLLDKPEAFRRFDIKRLAQLSDLELGNDLPDGKRINGLRIVNEKNNLFIFGKPGAGKTTFLKYVALKAAEQTIDKVPIFVSLKEWSDSESDLLPFIAERFDICNFPNARPFVEELLRSANAVVLFDGLDEVNQASGLRDRQTRAIQNFVERYDRTQCLITCRVAASDYSFQPFTYVEIAGFTRSQIRTFVEGWFRKGGDKDEETCNRFLAEFERDDNKGLRDLARTPLLLTLLCLAFNETLSFPQRRVEIYKEALDALLKKWDSSRGIQRDEVYRKLSLGHKENMFARIAAQMFEQNEYFIPQPKLEMLIRDHVKNVPPHDSDDWNSVEVILKAMEAQHGILVERARSLYSFSHRTLQEYFTAKYVVANAGRGSLTELIKMHFLDWRWHEVFLLTTSLLPEAREFVKAFRRAADDLIRSDVKLRAVLEWADRKSAPTQIDPWLARRIYFLRQSHIFVMSERVDNREHCRALNLDLSLFNALDRSYDRVPDLGSSNLPKDLDLAISDGLERCLNYAHTQACQLRLDDLAKVLGSLSIPSSNSTASDRQEFADELRVLLIKHRDIGHQWNLTRLQEETITDYVVASDLLLDCLELAFMSPDEKRLMLDTLYLLPSEVQE